MAYSNQQSHPLSQPQFALSNQFHTGPSSQGLSGIQLTGQNPQLLDLSSAPHGLNNYHESEATQLLKEILAIDDTSLDQAQNRYFNLEHFKVFLYKGTSQAPSGIRKN